MKIEFGHMIMAVSLISLVTTVEFMTGHIAGVEAYRMITAVAGTVALTYILASMFK